MGRRDRFARILERMIDAVDEPPPPSWDEVRSRRPEAPRPSDTGVRANSVSREDLRHDLRSAGQIFAVSVHETETSGRAAPKTEAALDLLCARYGVDVEMPREMGELTELAIESIADHLRDQKTGEPVTLAEVEKGSVGTPMFAGRIVKEPTAAYQPWTVRGSGGNAGLYEEYWRSESQIYDAVQAYTELLASGSWEVRPPKNVPRSEREAMKEFCAFHTARLHSLRCQRGGWDTFLEHAASAIPIGYSIFEPVFSVDSKKRPYLRKAGFREQSTVNRWFSNERGDDLIGAEFRTGGEGSRLYTLTATNDWQTNHIMLVNIGALGANWEGMPPTRPSLHWVKMKRVIAQIVPLCAEKWGIPIAYLRADPEYLKAILEGAALNVPDLDNAYEEFKNARSVDAPVFKFADGIIAELMAPTGEMPGLHEWIQYCDSMIAFPFSNEGNLLGMHSATGSYAQAEVKERRFLRSAPAVARRVAGPINQTVLRPLARHHFGELVEYPTLHYRPDGLQEVGGWLDNARKLFGPNLPVDRWPDDYQRVANEKMGMTWDPADEEAKADSGTTEPAAPAASTEADDLQRTALNGAQVTSMVEVVQQVASGQLPAESGIRILMRAFQMSREEAQALVNPAKDFDQGATAEPRKEEVGE